MTPPPDPGVRRHLIGDLLAGCGLDGLPALIATETLIDRLTRREQEEAAACR